MTIDLTAYKAPALHFSGGKDSLACLYLLRDQLNNVRVYWCNTGDACPETVEVIDAVRSWIPNFIEVKSDVGTWRDTYGWPSDLVPAKSHFLGVTYGMSQTRLTGRFDCCYYNLMLPMHERMLADKVDCVIRGTKLCDTGTVPAEGQTPDYTVLLPIKDWSHHDVFEYLKSVGAPQNAIYDHFKGISAPECLHCTAWWDDNKAAYLRENHPQVLVDYRKRLRGIKQIVDTHLDDLVHEIGE
jgi:phosphoadenosine phosphosulfate reductase